MVKKYMYNKLQKQWFVLKKFFKNLMISRIFNFLSVAPEENNVGTILAFAF